MILDPVEGKIFVDGVDITDENLSEESIIDVRRKIGMVFQNPDNQLVATIVEEDIAFGLRPIYANEWMLPWILSA